MTQPKWINVLERLPKEGYEHHLKYVYQNGNSGIAVGYYDEDEKGFIIEYSDDHPMGEDIKYWLEED